MIIQGSVVVVTGAARGIGFAIASAFAREGCRIVLTDANTEGLVHAVDKLHAGGAAVCGFECDVASDASVDGMIAQVTETVGPVDILVNNAGVGLGGPIEAIPMDDWRWIVDINLLGVARCIKATLPGMIERGRGHIVNVASSAALFPDSPQAIPYVTTKSAVLGMSRSLRSYLGPKDIGVTVLCPDVTNTGFRTSARIVGVERTQVTSTLSSVAHNSPDEVADALVEAVRNRRFLVALTPRAQPLFMTEAEALFSLADR